jgi:hypothetical protein
MQEAERKESASRQERDPWEGWFEVIAAVLLGLAMLASAWSAYQSGLWNGIQTFRLAEANGAGRQAAAKDMYGNQLRGIDAVMFERYVSALSEKNHQLAEFLFQRFRPEMKVAVEAWLATQPLKNPSAPLTPFTMAEYSLVVAKEAQRLHEEETKKFTEARKANKISDTYLLLTVLFGIVRFLSGIAAAFEKPRLRVVILALATVTMTAATIAMAFLPRRRYDLHPDGRCESRADQRRGSRNVQTFGAAVGGERGE